uniref:doublecortin domain-containing protein 1-like n=1 Tax=Styela clava TaxID=7725 RepID=UPI001939E0A5|nr:doublecortin domain-containing protein 1-like [Styela clava]
MSHHHRRRSSMSSYEEERILDEYRKKFDEKTRKMMDQPRERPPSISPYLQSVAPRHVSAFSRRPQSAQKHVRRKRHTSFTKDSSTQFMSKSFEGRTNGGDYSSSFESSDSDDSNEKENHPDRGMKQMKSILRNRPSSAPMHRRRHTHEGSIDSVSITSERKRDLPVFKRQPVTIRCTAYRNGSLTDPATLVAPDVKQLLVEATRKLGLNTAARRVYLDNGAEAFRAKDIPYNADVFISCGEQFKDPKKVLNNSGSLIASNSWTMKGVVLDGERRPVRRTMTNRLRRLAGKKSSRILVFLNGDGANGHDVIHLTSDGYNRLLDQSTSKLKMTSAARTTYGWDGKEVSNLEEVRQLDSCMKNGSSLILGPIWVSAGEGFNPTGALNFVEGILWGLKQRLEAAKIRNEQLDHACNGDMNKVTQPDIVIMSMEEIYSNIEQLDEEIEDMKKAQKKYKERRKVLKEMDEKQRKQGSNYTMQHIKEIKSDDRIVGQHGLRLKIYENGKDTNAQMVFVNMREILRGTGQDQDTEKLVRTRFLEHLSHWHKPVDPTGPAKSSMVRRMFDKHGEEIMNVHELQNEQEIWLSYGEEFKSAHVMALHVQLHPVMAFRLKNDEKIVIKTNAEVQANTKWKATNGFPEDYNCLRVENIDEKSETFPSADHYLQSKEDSQIVVKPMLMGDQKTEKKEPGTSQAWLIHRSGLITSRNYPQLALSLDEDQPITVEMSCGAEVTGYALTLQKKTRGNPAQQWEFNPSGQICSLHSQSATQVITMLDPDHFSSVECRGQKTEIKGHKEMEQEVGKNQDQTIQNQENAGTSVKIVVLEKMSGSRAKFQRWALKQDSIPNQWKHTKVANPTWKKLAYSWPVLPDGNWNLEYKWPMEGTFLNCPPPLRGGGTKSETTGTVPLKVMRNGEKNMDRFVTVVVPDLSSSSLANEKNSPDSETNVIKLEMNMFLERATSLLNLPFAARRIFNDRGVEVYSLRKLKRNQVVFVTCGETWQNPTVTKSEAQRRQLLAKLTADVKKINDYCILREPGDVVVTMESGAVVGSRLVVTQQVKVQDPATDNQEIKKETKESEAEDRLSTEEKEKNEKSWHQKSHEFSDNWMISRKYPWQLEKTTEVEPEKQSEEKKSPGTPRSGRRSPRPWQKNPTMLQKLVFKDGYLMPEIDPTLAVGVPGVDLEALTGTTEVRLCRKDKDDMTQRWEICSDGTIRLVCDHSAGLSVCLPVINNDEEPSPKNYAVVLQKLRTQAAGSANQHWKLEPESHLLKAFYSSVVDKEVTAANHVSICTHTVRGPEPLNQDGYIVELKGASPSNPVMVCRSCATVMRGRFTLTHAPSNWLFICAMGNPKKNGLKLHGSFKCLNGKVDLSTYEAEPTLKHWVAQLHTLRQESSVRSINRDLNNAECNQAWRLLIRRNGEGYKSKPEIVVGSSVTGILDQCSHKLRITSAARRLYTEDGTQILHMDQLKQWVQKVGKKMKKIAIVKQPEVNTDNEQNGNTTEVKTDKANDGTNSTEGTPDHSTAEFAAQDLTRKSKKTKPAHVQPTMTESFAQELPALPIVEIWVSCGENFINPVMADKMSQESLAVHTERNAKNLVVDTQRHVIRQIHGRRRGQMAPAELIPTKDTRQPVVVTGGWTEATREEDERAVIMNQVKEDQKPKRPKSASRLKSGIYKQPQMKRITVRPVDDQAVSVYAWGNSLDSLLDDAASRLGIRRIARVFYTKEGVKIKNFEEIERNAELLVNPKRPGSTIRMKTIWARTRKAHGPSATEIVLNPPTKDTALSYVPPSNVIVDTTSSSSSSSDSDV